MKLTHIFKNVQYHFLLAYGVSILTQSLQVILKYAYCFLPFCSFFSICHTQETHYSEPPTILHRWCFLQKGMVINEK